MKLLNFLSRISNKYGSLKGDISMCYHISDDELFINPLNEKESLKIQIKKPFGDIEDGEKLFENFISDWEEKKIKVFLFEGMYFLPGGSDNAIIFSCNLEVAKENNWVLEDVKYEIIEL